MKRATCSGVLALTVATLLTASVGPPNLGVVAQSSSRYFPETGHTVRGPFLQYWETQGGLAQQGYPLTDEVQEVSATDGRTYQMQYFERAVFESHPEKQAAYQVLLSLLGVFAYQQRYGAAGAPNQHASTDHPRVFPETGHTVGGTFRAYWEQHGGLQQQGYPISEEFAEVSALNGQRYTVQYFERAVFEHHPENAGTPFAVLLSQLGTFRYQARHVGLALPPAGPDRQQFSPRGSDSYLVWAETARGPQAVYHAGIRGLDLQTNQPLTVTDDLRQQYNPAISGSRVIWEDHGPGCPPDCSTGDILGKDLATGQTFPVATGPNYQVDPAIHGTTVAWLDQSQDAIRLLTRDLGAATPQMLATIPLTNGMGFGPSLGQPVISDDYIVWAQEGPADVMKVSPVLLQAYDRSAGTTQTVAQYTKPALGSAQYRLDGHVLIWTDWSGLHFADLRSGERAQLWRGREPSAALIQGDLVLWSGVGPTCCGQGNIYGLRLGDRQPRVLVSSNDVQIEMTIAGDWLVWQSTGPDGTGPFQATRLAQAFALAPLVPPTPTPGPVDTPAPLPTVGLTETPHATETPGPLSFQPAPGSPFAVDLSPYSMVPGDFNGDGHPDLVATTYTSGNVTVLLGNGRGGFSPAPGPPSTAGDAPYSMAVGDFNGDGYSDLAIADILGNEVSVLLGNSRGGFSQAPGSSVAVGFSPTSVAVGDFNGDGHPDLVIANGGVSGVGTVTVLLGDGRGGFRPAPGSPFAVGISPASVAVGDFNGDSHPDLVTANADSKNVTVLLGDGRGGFSPAPGSPFAVGSSPASVAVGDFNGDGHPDLVTANEDNNVTVLLGDGRGGFRPAPGSPFAVGSGPHSVVVSDFNGDGHPDLTTANQNSNTVTVLLGNGSGGFSPAPGSPFAVGRAPASVAVSDFNGDGHPDLATGNSGDNTVTVLLNTFAMFTPTPDSPTAPATAAPPAPPATVVAGPGDRQAPPGDQRAPASSGDLMVWPDNRNASAMRDAQSPANP